jgi:HAD superfamily hydrolase (TIGR01509 family)
MKAVIFDMDGVMINSEPLWTEFYPMLLKSVGFTGKYDEGYMKREMCGRGRKERLGMIKKKFGLKPSLEELCSAEAKIVTKLYAKVDALEAGFEKLLKSLRKAGFKTAIASGAPPEIIGFIVKKFSLEKDFDAIVSGDEVAKGKPEPDIFLCTAKKLGIRPEDCIVVEDAPAGAEAAKRAGMKCVLFKRPYVKVDSADFIIGSFAEFRKEWLENGQ